MKRCNQPTPKLRLETDSTAYLVDWTEMQTALRLDGTADQALVQNLVLAVSKKIEQYTGLILLSQVWSIFFDYFPFSAAEDKWWDGVRDGAISELFSSERYLELPFGPCQTISQFLTFDNADSSYSFDSSNFNVDMVGPQSKLALRIGCVWPATVLRPLNAIQIKGTFGYGTVPRPILEAAKIMVTDLYENRGDTSHEVAIPTTAQMFLEPYRRIRVK